MAKPCSVCGGTGTVKFYRAKRDAVNVKKHGGHLETLLITAAARVPGDLLDRDDRQRLEARGVLVEAD